MKDAVEQPDFHDAVQSRDESPSGDRVVASTGDFLVCIDPAGTELWRFDFGPGKGAMGNARTNCRFSLDGTVVWLYRPDTYSGHGATDRWFVLDAATGAVLGDAALPTPGGHGAWQTTHPDGEHVLLEVGCGQDGMYLFRGRFHHDRLEWMAWPSADDPAFGDQSIAAYTPDGKQLMMFEHEAETVAFLDFPTGTVQWRITLQDLGIDREADQIETVFLWSGKYIGDRIAVVECKGETGEIGEDTPDWAADGLGEWEDYRAYRAIDLKERRVIGPSDVDGAHTGRRPRFVPDPD